jgi:GNAT superfamily N-acetyltransferase
VHIRDATPGDLPRVVELLALGGSRPGKEDPADLAPYLDALAEITAAPHSRALVAEVDGVVVGTCQVFAVRHLQEHGGRCAELESMHVHPAHRGRGTGATLLAAAVDVARGWGCYRVQLTSNEVRTDAHRFYARAGFTPSHRGFTLALSAPGDG